MAKYEEKFIVINKKRLEEIGMNHPVVDQFLAAMDALVETHDTIGDVKWKDRKYFVCNQDEDYAGLVKGIILLGESVKEGKENKSVGKF